MNRIFAAVFAAIFFICASCSAYAPEGKLFVTMLDVGQGDAFLIETPTQNILIDTGGVESRSKLVAQLNELCIERLERVILTHPHADHIGGLRAVLDNFIVDEISDNGFKSRSPLYKDYRDAGIKISALKAGDVLNFGDAVKFKVLNPNPLVKFDAVNNQSIVGKLTFGDFSMLFAADAEKSLEDFLTDFDIAATVLKAPHHGSKTSSTENFIANVKPEIILISAGKNNSFGHPHKSVLRTYRENFVLPQNIYCTAFNGRVRVESDGFNKAVLVEKENIWVDEYTGEVVTVTRLD